MKFVLFSGSHGTGKSTTLADCVENFPDIFKDFAIADSLSEKFFDREDFKNPEVLKEKQKAFTEYQLATWRGETMGDKVISSRSYADIWAYTKYQYERDNEPEYLAQLEEIERQAKEAILRGDTIFVYFPIAFEISGKALRSTNVEFQKIIDDNIKEFYQKMNISPLVVNVKDRGARAIFVSLNAKTFTSVKTPGKLASAKTSGNSKVLMSYEVPRAFLQASKSFNDYEYFLDIFNDAEVFEFYANALKSGRVVYLDNSLYERVHRNVPIDYDGYLALIQKLLDSAPAEHHKNLCIIAPDRFNDGDYSVQESKKLIELFPQCTIIAVCHGKTKSSLKANILVLSEALREQDIIAIPFGDDAFKEATRGEILNELPEIKQRVHILGLKHPKEFLELCKYQSKIHSIDTSLPVVEAIENRVVLEQDEKPKTMIWDVFNVEFDVSSILQRIIENRGVLEQCLKSSTTNPS